MQLNNLHYVLMLLILRHHVAGSVISVLNRRQFS